MTNILTLDTLKAKGACSAAQEKFDQIFPDGAPVAVETFVNVAGDFDWDCAAKLFLTPRNRVKFKNTRSAARDAYDTARDAAFVSYDASTALAYVTLTAAHDAKYAARDAYDAAFVAYDASTALAYVTLTAAHDAYSAARDAYDTAYKALDSAHDTSRATGFANLYIDQESQTL